nr:HupE/UreJ family protein [Parahaliea mediterranea]
MAPALAGVSAPVFAHSPIEGIGQFYGGLLHPLLVLPHALCLLAFALLVGQRGVRAMQVGYPPFLATLAIGLVLAGFSIPLGIASEPVLLTLTAACGVLVALQWSPPLFAFTLLGAVIGLVVGADSGVEGLSRQQTFAALLGCWLGAVVALIVIAGLVELFTRPWQRVVVRVLGSWGSASAILVLALALRGA